MKPRQAKEIRNRSHSWPNAFLHPLLSISLTSVSPYPPHVRRFQDSAGRERHLQGANVVFKGSPWLPDPGEYSAGISLNDQDFEEMRAMGLKQVRLGLMWPGLEPLPSQYNMAYIDEYDSLVKRAADYGIYTLVDNHQDAFNEYFCGEGVPDWARVTLEAAGEHNLAGGQPIDAPTADFYAEPKIHNNSFPTRGECAHSSAVQYQAAKESNFAYDELYRNVNGVGDSWAGMCGVVAERFANRSEVLGYELINEPFMGDFYRDPIIAVPYPNPHNADAKRLQPAYDRLNTSISSHDNETLVFFAGVTWDDAGPGFHCATGRRGVSTSVQMDAQMRGATRLGTGVLLTETWVGSKQIFRDDKIVYEAADDNLISWSYWEYKREDRTRTYAETVAGVNKSMHFDANDQSFTLEYELDDAISMPTEIRISLVNYPNSFDVEIGGGCGRGLEWLYDEANNPYVLYVQKK
ncbi:hypothetical protein TrLO_g1950 [Triparma laevis f. longispina]|uniref:Endoglycoceramidase n=1 Tax=Triparma laevis f. longispina TaxID=1714387 RepID=A0A9W7AQ94_9STRA|nr:hypothetical protein TrLO_g1950 [Triparma laevis f. longispina]